MATSIKLNPALKARIDALAKAQRRSAHWIMLEAIRDYVERAEARGGRSQPDAWASFQDWPQDEIEGAPGGKTPRDRQAELPPLRHWSEVLTLAPDPNPNPERAKAWERFKALKGAGARLGGGRSKDEIDAHIRWLRGDD